MTTKQLSAMKAGRERATKERHLREDEHLEVFRRWLKDERDAWMRLQFAREAYEPNSPAIDEAYSEWWLTYADNPQLPPDSAFKRDRGDIADDSDAS